MKILHVLAQMPAKTGSGVYFCNLIQRLRAYGHAQAAVFACQGAHNHNFDLLDADCQFPVRFQCKALPFPIAGMSDVMPYESTRYRDMDDAQLALWRAAFQKQLEAARAGFAPDVVILHHLWMLTSLGAQVFRNAVTVGVCHNTDLR